MRNLKRVLALALACVMMLGLMVMTGSAASYPDEAQINDDYAEAVEVLTNIGVFQGQGDGSSTVNFAPEVTLTRAEAATLVYRILTGDVNDLKTVNYDYTSFEDVKEGQWWTGYITYASNGGYVVGDGNGKFYPTVKVTGIEVLTMMLRAIGYGRQDGEFVGAGWKDRVLTRAHDLGIIGGISTDDLSKPAERQLVAQLLFNAITIPNIVNYSALLGYREDRDAQTLGYKTFGLVEVEGIAYSNEYADLSTIRTAVAESGKTVLVDAIVNGAPVTASSLAVGVTSDVDVLGQEVYVYAIEKTVRGATTYTGVSDVTPTALNVIDDYSNSTGTVPAKKVDSSTVYLTNYGAAVNTDTENNLRNGRGVTVKAIDNDGDGKYEYVLSTQKTLKQVTFVSTSHVALNGSYYTAGTIVGTPVKGDVVLAVSYGGRTYIQGADSFADLITLRNDSNLNQRYVVTAANGNKYDSALKSTAPSPILPFAISTVGLSGAAFNTTYNFYVDEYGNIIAYAPIKAATNYAMVLEGGYDYESGAYLTKYVKLLQADGQTVQVELANTGDLFTYIPVTANMDYATGWAQHKTDYAGMIVKYAVNADGTYTLSGVIDKVGQNYYAADTTNGTDGITQSLNNQGYVKGSGQLTVGSTNYAIDLNTICFTYNNVTGEASVAVGYGNIAGITASANTYVYAGDVSATNLIPVMRVVNNNPYTNGVAVITSVSDNNANTAYLTGYDLEGNPVALQVPVQAVDANSDGVTDDWAFSGVTTNGSKVASLATMKTNLPLLIGYTVDKNTGKVTDICGPWVSTGGTHDGTGNTPGGVHTSLNLFHNKDQKFRYNQDGTITSLDSTDAVVAGSRSFATSTAKVIVVNGSSVTPVASLADVVIPQTNFNGYVFYSADGVAQYIVVFQKGVSVNPSQNVAYIRLVLQIVNKDTGVVINTHSDVIPVTTAATYTYNTTTLATALGVSTTNLTTFGNATASADVTVLDGTATYDVVLQAYYAN